MFYQIKTDRLVLRPLAISDLETVYRYASDWENTRYMIWLPSQSREETAEFLARAAKEWEKDAPAFFEFAIVFQGLPVGAVSVSLDEERKTGELGWILDKRYWKRGIATEAASAIRDFAFRTLKVEKCTAHCDDRNAASFRVMEKIGMKLESDDGWRTYPKSSETAKERAYSLAACSQAAGDEPAPVLRQIALENITADLLLHFRHRQVITRKWGYANGRWELAEASEVREWSREKRIWITEYLKRQMERGGAVAGAFRGDRLIGFGSLDGVLRGSKAKYANLTMLFVDDGWQGKGIGRALFQAMADRARAIGADKVFISSIPSLETVSFYFRMGCADAGEIPAGFVDSENDRCLEYPL